MYTRTLNAAAATLIASGLATASYGLLGRTQSPAAVRIGFLVFVSAIPAVIAAQTQAAATATSEQLAAAHNVGYRKGLAHAACGLLTPPPPAVGGQPGSTDSGDEVSARGRLRAVRTYDRPERHAE